MKGMFFWFYMLCSVLLLPGTMVFFGRWFLRRPPQNINAAFGYRTKMSMKNKETWAFAHKYCGGLWYRWGKVLLVLSFFAMLAVIRKSVNTIGLIGGILCAVQLVFLAGAVLPTEKALKNTFDANGNQRDKSIG